MKKYIFVRVYKRLNFLVNDYIRKTLNNKKYMKNAREGCVGKLYGKERVICSITTIPSRINFVIWPVLSMLHQTIRPDIINIYLDKDRYNDVTIPQELKELEPLGVNIRFVKDYHVHTKYYHAFKEYPDDIIITVDDDIVYKPTIVENLLLLHEKYPANVICSRAHRITFDEHGDVKSYNDWEWDAKSNKPDMTLLATGVGGVLYVPSSFKNSPCRENEFNDLSLNNDDLWLKGVEFENNILVVTLPGRQWYSEVIGSQIVSLNSSNVHQNRNDRYWKALTVFFGMTRESLLHERK